MVYTHGMTKFKRRSFMPKTKVQISPEDEPFGPRLALLRQAAGYSQRNLSRETGISQRMIAYYEKQPNFPPVHVLTALVSALGVSTQDVMGEKGAKSGPEPKDMRIRQRLEEIEKLDEREKRQVIQLLDTFIEKNRLKQQAMGG
jgi:transcriptional regulator with XRE-family HTH domain